MNLTRPLVLALLLTTASPALAGPQNAPSRAAVKVDPFVPRTVADLKGIQARVQLALPRARACTVRIGGGSGVMVGTDGYVLTAAHVDREAGREISLVLADGRTLPARTLGNFAGVDAGLARIRDGGTWPHAEMGRSDSLRQGQWCFALGYPAALERRGPAPVRLGRIVRLSPTRIYTDCMLMGGDSGGPLFDLDGRVIGIHSSASGRTGNAHVPIDQFRENWKRLSAGEDWGSRFGGRPPKFGIVRRAGRRDALEVAKVTPASPAARTGLQPGDVILRIGTKKVRSYAALLTRLRRYEPGEEVPLEILRGGEKRVLKVVAPDEEPMPRTPPGGRDSRRRGERARPSGRGPSPYQRDHEAVMRVLGDISAAARRSTVQVLRADQVLAAGTVVEAAAGLVITPASALGDNPAGLACRLPGGEVVSAAIAGRDPRNDLALLRISAADLVAISWSEASPVEGSCVLSLGPGGQPAGIGVVSRGIMEASSARAASLAVFVGGSFQSATGGLRVESVTRSAPLDRAGLRAKDILETFDGKAIASLEELRALLAQHKPGDQVEIVARRGEKALKVELRLARRPAGGRRSSRDRWGGGPFSKRRSGFASVLPHDTYLAPASCGGALLDLDGRALGVNISRASRVASFAVPAAAVRAAVQRLRAAAPQRDGGSAATGGPRVVAPPSRAAAPPHSGGGQADASLGDS